MKNIFVINYGFIQLEIINLCNYASEYFIYINKDFGIVVDFVHINIITIYALFKDNFYDKFEILRVAVLNLSINS